MMILREKWLIYDSKYKIITGDLNAKIGTKAKEETFKSTGAFGEREMKEEIASYISEVHHFG